MSTSLVNFHKHVHIKSGSKADVSDGSFGANGFTKQAASLYDYSPPWFLMVTEGLPIGPPSSREHPCETPI